MKCSNCNCELNGNFAFCPKCGAKIEQYAYTTPNPMAVKIPAFLKSGLFLAICILTSAGAFLQLISDDIPVLSILMSIFLWLLYATSVKGNPAYSNYMRLISGTMFAKYVVNWVLCGAVAFFGVLMAYVSAWVRLSQFSLDDVSAMFGYSFDDIGDVFYQGENILDSVFSLTGWGISVGFLFMAVICILAAIVLALVNIFGTRSIHKLAQSLYRCEMGQTNTVVKFTTAKKMGFGFWNIKCRIGNRNAIGTSVFR